MLIRQHLGPRCVNGDTFLSWVFYPANYLPTHVQHRTFYPLMHLYSNSLLIVSYTFISTHSFIFSVFQPFVLSFMPSRTHSCANVFLHSSVHSFLLSLCEPFDSFIVLLSICALPSSSVFRNFFFHRSFFHSFPNMLMHSLPGSCIYSLFFASLASSMVHVFSN